MGDLYRIEQVAAMGQIAQAGDLVRYIPLTGREPQLKEQGPAWVIQFRGDLTQRTEVWTDPVCVVTSGGFGFYATGPVRDINTGTVYAPERPAVMPDKALPPLSP